MLLTFYIIDLEIYIKREDVNSPGLYSKYAVKQQLKIIFFVSTLVLFLHNPSVFCYFDLFYFLMCFYIRGSLPPTHTLIYLMTTTEISTRK